VTVPARRTAVLAIQPAAFGSWVWGAVLSQRKQALAPVGIRRVKEILTNSLTTYEPVQTTALVKEIEPVVKKDMYGKLLIAVAAFLLRRQWLMPPADSASSTSTVNLYDR